MEILDFTAYICVCFSLLINIRERYNNDSGCYFQGKKWQQCIWAEPTSLSSSAMFRAISLCITDTGMSHAAVREAYPQALAPYFRLLW